MENVDNSLRRNNIHLKGIKEGVEGNDHKQFLEEIFAACLGSECDVVIQIVSGLGVGSSKQVP